MTREVEQMVDGRLAKEVGILASCLAGTPLMYPCLKLWKAEGWCKKHCSTAEPDAECWLKYAEVIADE